MRDRIPLLMRAGLVRPTLRNSMQPAAANLSSRLASAHELEADAAQRVTTHAAVVDAEGDTLYGDAVGQNWNGTPGRCEMYCAGLSDADWLAVCDCSAVDELREPRGRELAAHSGRILLFHESHSSGSSLR